MSNHPTHVLTVTGQEDDEGYDSRDYTLTCPGVTNHCRAWWECLDKTCDRDLLFRDLDDSTGESIQHGQVHRYIDIGWTVRSNDCLYAANDRLPDVADALDLPAGTYEVDVDYVGDMEIVLVLLSPRPEVVAR